MPKQNEEFKFETNADTGTGKAKAQVQVQTLAQKYSHRVHTFCALFSYSLLPARLCVYREADRDGACGFSSGLDLGTHTLSQGVRGGRGTLGFEDVFRRHFGGPP